LKIHNNLNIRWEPAALHGIFGKLLGTPPIATARRAVLMPINNDDIDTLRNAVRLLEHPSLAARLTNMLGKPIELMSRALPAGASQANAAATTKSLEAALKLALLTIRNNHQESSQQLHRALAVASGAAGGAFGILSLPLELRSRPSSSYGQFSTLPEAKVRI
jgi:hypothetical protein